MKINREDFQTLGGKHDISEDTLDQFWNDLESKNNSGLNIPNLAYYLGAMVIISAMAWYLTKAWVDASGLSITIMGAVYFVIFAVAGHFLYRKDSLKIPGGLLLTVAVSVIPLLVFGIERLTGLWPESRWGHADYQSLIDNSWIIIEVATVSVGLVFILKYRFPFLTLPVALALWYLSMDLAPLIFGDPVSELRQKAWTSIVFGLVTLFSAYLIDRRTNKDFAFWGYLFGLMAFWGGMTVMDSDSETGKLVYCLINLALMFVSVFLQRRVFLVFGAMGLFYYLGYLSYNVFEDSMIFPIVLTMIGLLIIGLGIFYHQKRDQIDAGLQKLIPDGLKRFAPRNRLSDEGKSGGDRQ
jgi:hypothetical protein